MVSRHWIPGSAVAVLVTAGMSVGCGGPGGGDPDHTRPKAAVKDLAPQGAEVARLTFFDRDKVTLDVDTSRSDRAGQDPVTPLIAYRELCGDLRRDEFGLARPRMRVRLRQGSEDAGSLAFGNQTFTGGGIYASREGSSCIYLVTTQAVATIARLAGEAAAVPFEPVRRPEPDLTGNGDQEPVPPWVAQAKRQHGREG